MSIGSQLSALLGSQLVEVIPPEFSVEADNGDVTIDHSLSPLRVHVGAIVGDSGVSADAVTTASLAVISDVQDYITRVLGTPWPPADPPTRLALPFAGWRGDRLRLLYGDPEDPVLELRGLAAKDCGIDPSGVT